VHRGNNCRQVGQDLVQQRWPLLFSHLYYALPMEMLATGKRGRFFRGEDGEGVGGTVTDFYLFL